jgi:hypothetical protein
MRVEYFSSKQASFIGFKKAIKFGGFLPHRSLGIRVPVSTVAARQNGDSSEAHFISLKLLVGTGRFELPTPRTPSECSTRLR